MTTALRRAPVGGDRNALVTTVARLTVVDRCACGCASVDFESPLRPGAATLLAHGLAKLPSGEDVGCTVWGDELHVTGLEIYGFGDSTSASLPVADSLRPWTVDERIARESN